MLLTSVLIVASTGTLFLFIRFALMDLPQERASDAPVATPSGDRTGARANTTFGSPSSSEGERGNAGVAVFFLVSVAAALMIAVVAVSVSAANNSASGFWAGLGRVLIVVGEVLIIILAAFAAASARGRPQAQSGGLGALTCHRCGAQFDRRYHHGFTCPVCGGTLWMS